MFLNLADAEYDRGFGPNQAQGGLPAQLPRAPPHVPRRPFRWSRLRRAVASPK